MVEWTRDALIVGNFSLHYYGMLIALGVLLGVLLAMKREKKLGLAKGYWGNKSRHYKMANQQLMKSGRYAYVGRKLKKRDFRQLWITRISAGCKMNGMNYSTFMHGLKKAGIDMNRKMLSELAIHDAAAFTALCEKAKASL